jgi:hypothetical protein
MTLRVKLLATALGAAVLIGGPSSPALAAPADDTSTVADRALAHSATVARTTPATMSRLGTAEAFDGRVGGSITSDNRTIGLALSAASWSAPTKQEADGSRTFATVARDTGAAVRIGDGTVQILSVMRSKAAPTEQSYNIDLPAGTTLAPRDGGFDIVGADGAVAGTIASPWAVDATGRSLPTSYRLEGSTIVQRTDTSGAAFPVVADPKLTYGLGVYLNMWGSELRAYAIVAIAVLGTGVAVSCTLLGNIPNAVLRSLAALACGAGAVNLTKVFQAMKTIYNSNAINNSSCYQIKIIPTGSSFKTVSSGNCS